MMSDEIETTAAVALSTSAIQAALISRLKAIGLFSGEDERELHEHALLMLESQRTGSPSSRQLFEAARALIEEQLRAS